MAVDAERTGFRLGGIFERWRPWWIRSLAGAAQVLAAITCVGALYLAWTITGSTARATAITMIGLAGVSGAGAFAARWAHAALADRLDILSQALDAAPDPHMIVAAGGRMAYANLAFDHLFPEGGEPPLDRIERSMAPDPKSVGEFRRLRSRAAAGNYAIARGFPAPYARCRYRALQHHREPDYRASRIQLMEVLRRNGVPRNRDDYSR